MAFEFLFGGGNWGKRFKSTTALFLEYFWNIFWINLTDVS